MTTPYAHRHPRGACELPLLERASARLVVLDTGGRVLLFQAFDPLRAEDGAWWATPGGGLEPGEAPEDGARRELYEETGIVVDDVGEIVLRRRTDFDFEGRHVSSDEVYFRVVVDTVDALDDSRWTAVERRTVLGHRWWSLDELRVTREIVFPEQLVELVEQLCAVTGGVADGVAGGVAGRVAGGVAP